MFHRLWKKTHDWVARLVHHKFAEPILGLIAFAESSFFPIPVDFMLAPMVLLRPKRWLRLAMIVTIFSVLGGLFGYLIGWVLFDTIGIWLVETFNLAHHMDEIRETFNRGTFLAIFISAFTPIPFKIFAIAGGLFKVNIIPFIVAAILGRGARFFIESYLVAQAGEHVNPVKHPVTYVVLAVVVVVGIVVLVI